ncbi:hypothetical protein PAMC26510_22545 [Caballeronia sordidicola]|uniref:Uncharacterized protein n=1 Tax=Caballeronia sordidicola TaxID=196367 RepID=A0A242ML85_CABSO|nr:hypothetical protein PAMC26510_22545 [Caballeronia sordidicola]
MPLARAMLSLNSDTARPRNVSSTSGLACGADAFRRHPTEQFNERFFLEIVERRGGYEGYGAANAPVRLAAHAQRAQAWGHVQRV